MNKVKKIAAILLIVALVLAVCTGCNKQIIDLKYNFKYAIVQRYDGEQIIELRSWNDYDGEQIQLVDTDGRTWLVSSYNTILISKAE